MVSTSYVYKQKPSNKKFEIKTKIELKRFLNDVMKNALFRHLYKIISLFIKKLDQL